MGTDDDVLPFLPFIGTCAHGVELNHYEPLRRELTREKTQCREVNFVGQ
jgi:hypothetical protein